MAQKITKASCLRKYFPQLITGFSVTMVMLELGISSGWSSPYLARLTAPNSPLPLSLSEASWVASLLNLGRFVGAFLGAVSVNYLGSKRTMLLDMMPISLCWILTLLASSAEWLYAARFFGGLGLGTTYSSYPLYLGEVALPKIRGSLVSLAACGGTFGIMIGNAAGSYLDMDVSSGIYLAPCIVLMILFVWLPESPHHLVKIGVIERAKKSVQFYRAGLQVDEEFDAVKKFASNANTETFSEKLTKFRQPALVRATILVVVLWTFMQISGFNSVLFYMEIILIQGKSHLIEPKVVVIYVSASAVLASALSIFMIDRCGRKVFTLFCGWANVEGLCQVTMVMLELGISSGWSSPYLARLTAPGSPLPLSLSEASWMASVLNLGRFLGAFVGSVSVNYLGSKRTMLLNVLPIAMCWTLTMLASSAEWLYAARFSGGLGLGMTYSSYPLYMGEVALPEIRGTLVSLVVCGGTFGMMLGNVAGSYLDLKLSSGIYLAPCIALMALFVWLPESPHHLVKIGDLDRAKKSVQFYRADLQVDEELDAVKKFVSNASTETFSKKLTELRQPTLVRATILVVVLCTFMQLSGFNSVLFYMEIILIQGKFNLIEPKIIVMYVSASAVLASALSIFMIDRCGRRILLVISSLRVTLSMIGLGTHFYLIDQGYDVTKNLQWLPVASLLLFDIAFYVGFSSVPSAILSELFPTNVKCIAACFASLSGAIFAFISTKSYQPLIGLIGQSNVYFMHPVLSVIIVSYVLICMPETKGKTLQQIQDDLMKRYIYQR